MDMKQEELEEWHQSPIYTPRQETIASSQHSQQTNWYTPLSSVQTYSSSWETPIRKTVCTEPPTCRRTLSFATQEYISDNADSSTPHNAPERQEQDTPTYLSLMQLELIPPSPYYTGEDKPDNATYDRPERKKDNGNSLNQGELNNEDLVRALQKIAQSASPICRRKFSFTFEDSEEEGYQRYPEPEGEEEDVVDNLLRIAHGTYQSPRKSPLFSRGRKSEVGSHQGEDEGWHPIRRSSSDRHEGLKSRSPLLSPTLISEGKFISLF